MPCLWCAKNNFIFSFSWVFCVGSLDLRKPFRQSHSTAKTELNKKREVEFSLSVENVITLATDIPKSEYICCRWIFYLFFAYRFWLFTHTYTQLALFIHSLSLVLSLSLVRSFGCSLCQLTIAWMEETNKKIQWKLFFKLWMRLCVWIIFFFQWKHNTQTFTQCRLRETNDLEQLVMTPLITIEQLKRNYGRFFFWFFRFMKLFLSIDHTNWNSCDSNSPVNELHQESPFELCFVVECVKLLPFLF